MKTYRTVLIRTVGLLTLCVAWGIAMNAAMNGVVEPWLTQLRIGVGIGAPIFLVTAAAAGLIYVITKDRTTMFVTWTSLVLLAVMVVAVGAAQGMRHKLEAAEAGRATVAVVPDPAPESPPPSSPSLRQNPIARLTVDELLAAYRENEFAAAATYGSIHPMGCVEDSSSQEGRCRFVQVTAELRSLGRNQLDVPELLLGTAEQEISVPAAFPDPQSQPLLRQLRAGQRVALTCIPFWDPRNYSPGLLLTRCSVAEPTRAE